MTEIKLLGISKVYGSGASATVAVRDVTLTVAPGEFFFLLGPSGCGKTTLLRILAGLVEPTGGRVLLGGRDVTHLSVEDRRTALVFQNYALWPHMTVAQNVEFGPRMRGADRSQRQQVVQDNLHRVEMEEYGSRRPNELSGGQQQRVALARALAAKADCLLLDEPLSNLDARLRQHMRLELRRLVKSTGVTALYVTHDQSEALSMSDRIAVMNAGRVVQLGTPTELYHRPRTRFVANFLGETNFLQGRLSPAVGGGPTMIQTPAGELPAPQGLSHADATVLCCVRPERVRIAPAGQAAAPGERAGAAGESSLAAKVDSVSYQGATRQYNCRLGDGTVWKVTVLTGREPSLEVNQPVRLTIWPDDVALLGE